VDVPARHDNIDRYVGAELDRGLDDLDAIRTQGNAEETATPEERDRDQERMLALAESKAETQRVRLSLLKTPKAWKSLVIYLAWP